MSSTAASVPAFRRRARLKLAVSEPIRSLGIVLTACYASMSQYILGEAPEYSVIAIPEHVFLLATLALIVVPTIGIYGLGRYLHKHRGDRALARFHTGIILFALLLYMRQAEIYSDSANEIEGDLNRIMPLLSSLAFALVFGMVGSVVLRFPKVAQSFFAVLALPALILTAVLPFVRFHQSEEYRAYSTADVGSPDPSKPTAIVLVFDEFSTEALLDDTGQIDATRFPNFARLAADGLFVDNAQSNFFHTWIQVPFLADSALSASSEYDPRLYLQLNRIERIYADNCGKAYTCRGMRYVSEKDKLELAFRLATRAVTRPIPTRLLELTGDAGLATFDSLGVAPPSASKSDMHVLTKDLFATFLGDIDSDKSRGQLYFVHSLLPHVQYLFNERGEFQSFALREYQHQRAVEPENIDGLWPAYLEQVEYADSLLGDLIEKLTSEGLWDETVLLITADHGARRDFPTEDRSIELEPMTPSVPLFIKAPGIGPTTPHLPYQHVDFGPTLLDVLDIDSSPTDPISPELRALIGTGRSIFGEADQPRPAPFYVNYRESIYWRYDFDALSEAWELTHTYEEPIPDNTAFK